MKNLFTVFMVAALTISATLTSHAQGPFMISGKRAQFTAPKGITANSDYLFPTFKIENTVYADDTTTLTVKNLENWVSIDSISQTSWLILTNASYVLPGVKVYLNAATTGAPQTLYVKQGSYVVDTLTVTGKTNRTYVYNGTQFVNVVNTQFPIYRDTIAQASSITTGVTLNADAGSITTVSSTIAADDSSASFTWTNNFIKPTSTILFTVEYGGNGVPHPQVTSKTTGSAVIRLYNVHRTAALNNKVKLHFTVLNEE